MKTIMKKSLCFLIGLFILFSFNCYAGETLTAQQKEAEVWYEKANSVDTLALKIEYYSKAIELDPKLAAAYNNRGAVFKNLGEYQKAIDDYSKAIEINPKFTQAYNNRGAVFKNLGEYQKAIDDYSKAIELDPKFTQTYNNRGAVFKNLGEYQKAIDDYSKAIELNPKFTQTYNNRGAVFKNLGEYQKAIDDYSKAIELNPRLAATYNNRGHAYAVQKASTAACGDFYQAGILFLKQNNTTQALICVDWIKKINPSSPLINKFMDQINK